MPREIYQVEYKTCTGSGKASGWSATGTAKTFIPKSLKVDIETVASSGSGRTADGNMYVKYLKTDLRKIEIELPPYGLSDANYNAILNDVVGKVCEVTYTDPYTHAEKVSKFYCSSGKGEYYSGVVLNGCVQGVSFSWIEME